MATYEDPKDGAALDVRAPAYIKDRIVRALVADADLTLHSLAETAGAWGQWAIVVADERTFNRRVKVVVTFLERDPE